MTGFSPSSVQTSTSFTTQVDRINEPEWNELLGQFEDSSVYQTWAYGAVCWGEGQLSHLLVKQADEVVGMAQLRIVRLPLLASGIAYLRWGPLCRLRDRAEDSRTWAAVINAVIGEYAERRHLLIRLLPNAFQQSDAPAVPAVEWTRAGFRPNTSLPPYRTIHVDLTASTDVLRKRLDQKWRNQLNGAERNGLEVLEGTSDELFLRFEGIYRELLERKQFETTVSISAFRRIQQRLPVGQKLLVLLCQKQGKLMAGLVASVIGSRGIYLLGATSSEGLKAKGSYLLQWRLMQWLKEHGCLSYDLGGINPDRNPGVYHFKSGFGGQEVWQCPPLELSGSRWSSLCVSAGERLKRQLAALKALARPRKATALP